MSEPPNKKRNERILKAVPLQEEECPDPEMLRLPPFTEKELEDIRKAMQGLRKAMRELRQPKNDDDPPRAAAVALPRPRPWTTTRLIGMPADGPAAARRKEAE